MNLKCNYKNWIELFIHLSLQIRSKLGCESRGTSSPPNHPTCIPVWYSTSILWGSWILHIWQQSVVLRWKWESNLHLSPASVVDSTTSAGSAFHRFATLEDRAIHGSSLSFLCLKSFHPWLRDEESETGKIIPSHPHQAYYWVSSRCRWGLRVPFWSPTRTCSVQQVSSSTSCSTNQSPTYTLTDELSPALTTHP